MTRLDLVILQQLLRSAAACRRVTSLGLARKLHVAPAQVALALVALKHAGLVTGTRLTLSGLAVAVATRPARRRAHAVALAA